MEAIHKFCNLLIIAKLVDHAHGLQDFGMELRNALRNWRELWDWQNYFCNSVSLECESVAIGSLSEAYLLEPKRTILDGFAILLSYSLGFRVFYCCFKYMHLYSGCTLAKMMEN